MNFDQVLLNSSWYPLTVHLIFSRPNPNIISSIQWALSLLQVGLTCPKKQYYKIVHMCLASLQSQSYFWVELKGCHVCTYHALEKRPYMTPALLSWAVRTTACFMLLYCCCVLPAPHITRALKKVVKDSGRRALMPPSSTWK